MKRALYEAPMAGNPINHESLMDRIKRLFRRKEPIIESTLYGQSYAGFKPPVYPSYWKGDKINGSQN